MGRGGRWVPRDEEEPEWEGSWVVVSSVDTDCVVLWWIGTPAPIGAIMEDPKRRGSSLL